MTAHRPNSAIVPIFVLALFANAALIFMLQPLFARMVTPMLGGSPAVWNTSMVFFQAALLAGYVYTHLLQRLRSVAFQAAVHATLLLLAGLVLPVRPTDALGAPNVQHPTLWLLGVLTLSVGAPYVIASATAPLMQAWYARTGRDDAGDPYFLYSASNVGSLLGLLAYPLAVEPLLGAKTQGVSWALGYAGSAVLVVTGGVLVAARALPVTVVTSSRDAGERISWARRGFWIAAAAVPSSLLVGTTQHILTDVASAPFLWVPPLALYLLTYVIAFRKGARAPAITLLALHAASVAMIVAVPSTRNIVVDVLIRLAALFTAALVCHGALAVARPSAARLTEFYNCVSLGGVIGGGITALVAPVVFDRIAEFPLALAATWFFRPQQELEWKPLANTFLLGGIVTIVASISGWLPLRGLSLGILSLAVFLNRTRPWAAAPLIISSILLVDALGVSGKIIYRTRSFFGAYRVIANARPDGTANGLLNGSTLHGLQWRDSARAGRPLSYYAERGALYQAVRAALPANRPGHVVLIGLGSGTMACVLRPGDRATFLEIDPAVEAIARNPRLFAYLNVCPRHTEVRLGDGRLLMQRFAPASVDVVLGDAFSSDAIPVHLLTREAVRLYMRAIRPGGALVLHVSNRHLAVANEAVRVAAAEGFAARYWRSPSAFVDRTVAFETPPSAAVVITHTPATMEALALPAHWKAAPRLGGQAWSDEFVDVVRALREAPIDGRATRARGNKS
jgi:predicted O-methyltransferase YrrM